MSPRTRTSHTLPRQTALAFACHLQFSGTRGLVPTPPIIPWKGQRPLQSRVVMTVICQEEPLFKQNLRGNTNTSHTEAEMVLMRLRGDDSISLPKTLPWKALSPARKPARKKFETAAHIPPHTEWCSYNEPAVHFLLSSGGEPWTYHTAAITDVNED